MNNNGRQEARKRAGLTRVRVHDLKHTFGRRLRAAGVSFEDRQDLLGHRSGRITTHYSAAELANLIDAANKVCDAGSRKTPARAWLLTIRSSLRRVCLQDQPQFTLLAECIVGRRSGPWRRLARFSTKPS